MRDQWQVALEIGVLLGAVATIPVTVLYELGTRSPLMYVADWAIWTVFVVDYVVGLTHAANRWQYARTHRLSAAVVIVSFPLLPAALALTRLARLARLFPLLRLVGVTARGMDSLARILGRRGLAYMVAVTGLLVFAGGGSLAVLEPHTVQHGFWEGIWWAIVTVTTVGYGDITPQSVGGRMVAILLMLSGVGLTSTIAASVAAYFVAQESGADLKNLSQKLDRIESLLNSSPSSRPGGLSPPNDEAFKGES